MIIDPSKYCYCNTVELPKESKCTSDITNCIKVCNLLIPSDKLILPCGFAGAIDITNYVKLPLDSTGSPIYTIIQHTNNIKNVSISSSAITFITDWSDGKDFKKAEIIYKVKDGLYSDIGYITIIFKQLGDYGLCSANQKYDACTGDCINGSSDLDIDGSDSAYTDNNTGFV